MNRSEHLRSGKIREEAANRISLHVRGSSFLDSALNRVSTPRNFQARRQLLIALSHNFTNENAMVGWCVRLKFGLCAGGDEYDGGHSWLVLEARGSTKKPLQRNTNHLVVPETI